MQTDASEERVSKYELIRLLGSGGMGEVYLARDTVLNRQVAIKFVSPERLGDPGAEHRLLYEARAAATLDHPCICPIYEVHVDRGGRTCIVMQYVEGDTLAQRLARGAMDPAEALDLTASIADALAVAHAHGIIHRDLKPQNIVLMADGRPKLLDFGIAQIELSPEAIADVITHTDTGTWSPGAVVGTPAYMSPEQVLRQPLDPRSDLFSLGAVLFECLTARPAFQAATDVDTWARVVYVTPPAPSHVSPGVPPAADAIVAALLAKDPAGRPLSARDAAQALRAARPAGDVWRGRASVRRAQRIAIAVATIGTLATVGVSGWRLTHSRTPRPPQDAADLYNTGTRHIRNGAYYSAQQALRSAVDRYPDYPQAWARLAEAQTELDDEREALTSILHVADLREVRLPDEDATRIRAVSALVRRDLPAALTGYQRIAEMNPNDEGAWLDLGRVRETAGLRADARAAYQNALKAKPQYAAAHLRLGQIAAAELRRDDALKEYDEAERIYRASTNAEGLTETLLWRAKFLSAIGDYAGARAGAAAAAAIARDFTNNTFQQIRSKLLQSSIAAAEGSFSAAAAMAEAAANEAVDHGFGTLAAEGLIEVGANRLQGRDRDSAGAKVEIERGILRARQQGANLVAAHGTLQLGGLFLVVQQPRDALKVVEGVRPFLHKGNFRRYELVALSILSRAHEDLGEYAPAKQLAQQLLSVAESLNDEAEVAGALEPLAGLALATGSLPEALAMRTRLEAIHRRQNDRSGLGFDLVSRADLLIRLGRIEAAGEPLREIDAGIAHHMDAFVPRRRRALLLRAIADTIQQRFAEAESGCALVLAESKSPDADTTSRLAAVLLAYARARLRRPVDERDAIASRDGAGSPVFLTEMRYWRASTWLARKRHREALDEAVAALAALDRAPSPEPEWRLAAVAVAAARQLNDARQAQALAARAGAALRRLRADWQADAVDYDKRPDLIERRRAAGLS